MSATNLAALASKYDPARERAVLDVVGYVRRHGMGLYDLVDAVQDAEAEEAAGTLISEAGERFPDADVLAEALVVVLGCLADLSFELAERISRSGRGPSDLLAAAAWHGARLDELCGRLLPEARSL